MASSEQEKPLPPPGPTSASPRWSRRVVDSEAEAAAAAANPDSRYIRHRKCILCCGCATSTLVVMAVVVVILALTVFHVQDPTMTINDVSIKGLQLSSPAGGQLRTDVNITLGARVSVKNPNAAAFRFSNFTMAVYYSGAKVGEARVPAGNARARRTMTTNVTVVVLADKLVQAPGLAGDLRAGELEVGSYTVMKGRVKVLGIVKKHAVLALNCTLTIDIKAESVQIQHCSKHVSL